MGECGKVDARRSKLGRQDYIELMEDVDDLMYLGGIWSGFYGRDTLN